jgi:triphosphatase
MPANLITVFARAQTREKLKRVREEIASAVQHTDDPEAIHDLRVSIRRFMQCLHTFRGVFDPGPLKKLRRRLRKLMRRCGAVRTYDVALDVLREGGITKGQTAARIAAARQEAEQTLGRYLKKRNQWKTSTWNLKLRAQSTARSDWNQKQDLATNLRRILPQMAEEFFAAGNAAAAALDNSAALHRFRLHTKHFRYTLELFSPFYPEGLPQGLQALRGLQDRLGAINDCVAMMPLIADDRRAQAAVRRLLAQREQAFAACWKKVFPPAKLRWWKRWLNEPLPESNCRNS